MVGRGRILCTYHCFVSIAQVMVIRLFVPESQCSLKNRARCILNKEILDFLNEESVSGAHSGRASL